MRFTKSFLLLALLFVLLSIVGNLFVWMIIGNSFLAGFVTNNGIVSLCIDIPPTLTPIGDLNATVGQLFYYRVEASGATADQIYYYGTPNDTRFSSFSMGRTTGVMSFTPTIGELGNYTVTINVTHEICAGSDVIEKINFSIIELNVPPIWVNLTTINFGLTEDALFTMNISNNATDPNNDTITFADNVSIDFPSFNLTSTGYINFTPNDSDVGYHLVNITITDNRGKMNSSIFNFTVYNVNDPPLLDLISHQYACEDMPFNYTVTATDNDTLLRKNPDVLSFYDNTSLFVVGETTGYISFTPTHYQTGEHTVRIYVTDNILTDYKDAKFSLIETNEAPVMDAIGAQTVWVNETLYLDVNAVDEEQGSDNWSNYSAKGNLTFNSTFTNGTTFFTINATAGIINFTTNDSLLGTYTIRICVNDTGLQNQHQNISLCNDGNKSSACETISLTVTNENRPPNITGWSPVNLSFQIMETETIAFRINATDPEGTAPSITWYRNGVQVQYDSYNYSSNYTWETVRGDRGNYTVVVNVSDGQLASNKTWRFNVTKAPDITPPSMEAGGGGGGGGVPVCRERWLCSDWSICQNATAEESMLRLKNISEIVFDKCTLSSIKRGMCGFSLRNCSELSKCTTFAHKPNEISVCIFTVEPTCFDGIRNCHNGGCEILADCGGPCKECPTCSDGIRNQGEDWIDCGGPCRPCTIEYPKPSKCGDKRCEFDEILPCNKDCGFFWVAMVTAAISLFLSVLLSRWWILLVLAGRDEEKKKKLLQRIIFLTKQIQTALGKGEISLAKSLYREAKSIYDELATQERKRVYIRLLQLYSGIEKKEEKKG